MPRPVTSVVVVRSCSDVLVSVLGVMHRVHTIKQ